MPKPTKINYDAIPWRGGDAAPTRVRIRRLITRGRHGSELTLGVCEMEPGDESNLWSSMAENDARPDGHWYGPVEETYYCVKGRLALAWDNGGDGDDGDDGGTIEFGPGDAVYLAPGHHYRLKNVGAETAFFVYNMYPSQE